ncbi:MAG: HAMP domain-containing histidine kinase [Cyclobacteriaceae bacterium]|nr:HAMP domain-containing histidine kinase [Cyclobacteriaceae bacterium]
MSAPMEAFNTFINNLIPYRFQLTFDLRTKVRGFVISQVVVGTLLILIGLFFRYIEYDEVEFYLNTAAGFYVLLALPTLKLFKHFENYINLVVLGAYTFAFLFIAFSGGIYADETFWLALILVININYGKRSHVIFWLCFVVIFLGVLFYLQKFGGLELVKDEISLTERITTLFSFFMLLWAITYSSSRINKKRIDNQLKIIADHKRLLKEREDLMSVVAHDLKSPARRIEGLLSIFDKSNLTKDQREIIKMLEKTTHEGEQLIDDLIEATRFQSQLQIKPIVLNNLLDELTNGFIPIAEKKGIDIVLKRMRTKLIVESSVHQLKRILDNIISNAVKFSPPGKKVEISFEAVKDYTSISIKDHGPGFTNEDIPHMFQMFRKLSAQPTGGESSSGLGLSIVKNLTELLNGEIRFTTEIGKGSTFTLLLPNKFDQDLASKNAEIT